MKNTKKGINLNVDAVNYAPIATFKQEDNASLELILYKDGEVFNITGQTVKLGAYRPNKTIVEQLDGFTIDNNTLTINLKNNILAVHGIVEVDLTLTDSAGEMTTASFYLKVNKKVLGNDNIAASDEIDSLKQIKLDLTALNKNVKREENTRVANEKNRVSEEKIRQANEVERVNFYEDVAKPLVEDLSQYDKEIENIYHTIRENDYLPFEGENITIEHSLTGMTKDTVIEGRTYQNISIVDFKKYEDFGAFSRNLFTLTDGYLLFNSDLPTTGYSNAFSKNFPLLKPSTEYTLYVEVLENTLNKAMFITSTASDNAPFNQSYTIASGYTGIKKYLLTTTQDISNAITSMRTYVEPNTTGKIKLRYYLLEGDYTNKDVTKYFEGIKSSGEDEKKIITVGVGKNILKPLKNLSSNSGISINYFKNGFRVTSNGEPGTWRNAYTYNIKVKPNVKISLTAKKKVNSGSSYLAIRDKNSDCIGPNNIEGDRAVVTTPSDGLIKLYFYCTTGEAAVGDVEYTDIQLQYGENQADVPYVDYKDDRNEILLPIEDGLKGLPNGVCDTLESRKEGIYLLKRIGKVVFDGSEDELFGIARNDAGIFIVQISSDGKTDSLTTISNHYMKHEFRWNVAEWSSRDYIGENFSNTTGKLTLLFPKEKYPTLTDMATFRIWLQDNPIILYYELAQPMEIKLDIPSLNMKTFNEVTHMYFENSISPRAKFKAPVNVPATISTLRTRNESLEQENKELKEEVSVKTLKLHGQDIELTNSDLDLDFRIFELEMSIGLPINLNVKGMRNMARSPFEMMKILILNNNYDREDIEYKASRYLQGKRMTQAEYYEIISLMDANELVK